MRRILVSLSLLVAGCPEAIDISAPDAGTDAGSDAGTRADSGDAGREDAGPEDAGPPDAGPADSGCEPSCLRGVACGEPDGCGGTCLGTCPNDFEQVCHGGLCNEHSWCPQAKCDLWAGVGCPADESCYLERTEGEITDIACRAPGTAIEGADCSSDFECADGHGCLLGRCRRYCCRPANQAFVESSDCPGAGFCARFFGVIGFCAHICYMLAETDCQEDQVCVVSNDFAGVSYCVESTPAASDEGGPCEFANDCKRGLYCHDATCKRVCDPATAAPCQSGTCDRPWSGAMFGLCPPG